MPLLEPRSCNAAPARILPQRLSTVANIPADAAYRVYIIGAADESEWAGPGDRLRWAWLFDVLSAELLTCSFRLFGVRWGRVLSRLYGRRITKIIWGAPTRRALI
jgi:hypothetical protein